MCHFTGSDIFTKHWRGFQHCASFKVAVSRDIFAFFISLFQPIWAPNKHAKTGFLKNSFSRRYFKFDEKFDSAQANTARSQTLKKIIILRSYNPQMLIFRKICGNLELANTARSFAVINFVCAGLCLPS